MFVYINARELHCEFNKANNSKYWVIVDVLYDGDSWTRYEYSLMTFDVKNIFINTIYSGRRNDISIFIFED